MRRKLMPLSVVLLAAALVAKAPAPAVAQTMVCKTTTKTTTWYFSNGSFARHTETVVYGEPIEAS